MEPDKQIIEIALQVMSTELDSLIAACMDESGNPKAPDRKALMRARSMLPPRFERALKKQKE